MKTALIVHGHFYQPPRENPFSGVVPDQETAKPWENWNEAVYRTCYRPNAYSRYLTPEGKVKKISNNYSRISFNMGPSLLKWADNEHPFFINKLKEADKYSLEHTGHSNIIAQAYSHTILPLDSPFIRNLDIKWAIQDYKFHFGHSPEGFWCPECAVNLEVIDDLYKAGIKFLILSPWQAKSINNILLNGEPAPSDRPFLVKGIKHELPVFFYNPDYASGISFGHLLQDADSLYANLIAYKKKNNPALLHWATDGEIYGHHEAFGDMALAALIDKIDEGNEFELTNYAAYLESHPATEHAQLYLGEDGKGSSWSCCHGVGRWERNCGCHTGGEESWNQEWRFPLRNAFNYIEKEVSVQSVSILVKLLKTEKKALKLIEEYGNVLSGKTALDKLIEKKFPEIELSDSNLSTIASVLDIVRSTVNMYTSCGWFFNDIGGIEPRQNISYAVYTARGLSLLTGQDYIKKLNSILSHAKSNLSVVGTGKTIANEIEKHIPERIIAASYFVLNRHFALKEDYVNDYGYFKLLSIDDAFVRIKSKTTLRTSCFRYKTGRNDIHKIFVKIEDDIKNVQYEITPDSAPKRSLRIISSWIEKKLGKSINQQTFNDILESMDNYVQITSYNRNQNKDIVYCENLGLCIMAIQGQIMKKRSLKWSDRLTAIKQICNLVRICKIPEFEKVLLAQFNAQIQYTAHKFGKYGVKEQEAQSLIKLLRAIRNEGFQPDITLLQDVLYAALTKKIKSDLSKQTTENLIDDLNFSANLK